MDLSFIQARPVRIPQSPLIRLLLVGVGGTGSWIAPHLARVTVELLHWGNEVQIAIWDPDVVEEKNVPRSHFCHAEIGHPKAICLAHRYTTAWGVPIRAYVKPFEERDVPLQRDGVTVVIGAVDTAAGRRAMDALLARNGHTQGMRYWHLDAGNAEGSGQVCLGCTHDPEMLRAGLAIHEWCLALPAPLWQLPNLRQAQPEELAGSGLSCMEIAERNAQSLGINALMAAIVGQYLIGLLLTRSLKTFCTTFHLGTMQSQSLYTTAEGIARAVGDPHLFQAT